MTSFGELLRYYRRRSTDPEKGGPLSQQTLGKLLGEELGTGGYSGTAVSDWENHKSQIHKDHRVVLVSLIKVLHECGGLPTASEADNLLLSGNYRALNDFEKRAAFPEEMSEATGETRTSDQLQRTRLIEVSFAPRGELESFVQKYRDHSLNWPEWLLLYLGRISENWSSERVLRTVIWLGVWYLAAKLTSPLLHWPYNDQLRAWETTLYYIAGSIIIPLLIGALTTTSKRDFWQSKYAGNAPILRFYTHLGASLGFHIGYFVLFGLGLLAHFLKFNQAFGLLTSVGIAWPLILGYASAQQTPINLWQAYGSLRFKDGSVFAVFFLLGPAWGIFFSSNYPYLLAPSLGIPLISLSIAVLAAMMIRQRSAA